MVLPPRAVYEAKAAGKAADIFYCESMLDKTVEAAMRLLLQSSGAVFRARIHDWNVVSRGS